MGGLVRLETVFIEHVGATADLSGQRKAVLMNGQSWMEVPLVPFSSSLDASTDENPISEKTSLSIYVRPDWAHILRLDAMLHLGCLLRLHFADGTIMIAGNLEFPVHGTLTPSKGTRPEDSSSYLISATCHTVLPEL